MKRRDFALTAALSPLLMTACGGGGSNGGVEFTGAKAEAADAVLLGAEFDKGFDVAEHRAFELGNRSVEGLGFLDDFEHQLVALDIDGAHGFDEHEAADAVAQVAGGSGMFSHALLLMGVVGVEPDCGEGDFDHSEVLDDGDVCCDEPGAGEAEAAQREIDADHGLALPIRRSEPVK
mgnify:CR=1 FL=1